MESDLLRQGYYNFEEGKGVKMQALTHWHVSTDCGLIFSWSTIITQLFHEQGSLAYLCPWLSPSDFFCCQCMTYD